MARAQPVAPAPDRRRGVARPGRPASRPRRRRGWRGHGLRAAAAGVRAPSRTAARTPATTSPAGTPAPPAPARARARDRPARALLRRPRGDAVLADPDDTSGAVSVQHFSTTSSTRAPATWPLLESAFGELADRFPSPGCTSAATRCRTSAWSGSPPRSAGPPSGCRWIARDRHAVPAPRSSRSSGARPGGRSVCGRRRPSRARRPATATCRVEVERACRRLAARGTTWSPRRPRRTTSTWPLGGLVRAGGRLGRNSSLADIAAFDPTAGWSDGERANLLGVQACLWTEHVPDRPTMERLLFPRLTAFADRRVARHRQPPTYPRSS